MSGSIPPYNPNSPGYNDYGMDVDGSEPEVDETESAMETSEGEDESEPAEMDDTEEADEGMPPLEDVRRVFWAKIADLRQGGSWSEMLQFANENKTALQGEVTLDVYLENELVKAEKQNDFLLIGRCAMIDTFINGSSDFSRLVEALGDFKSFRVRSAYVTLRSLGRPIQKLDAVITRYSEEHPRLARHFTNMKESYLCSKENHERRF